MIDFRELALETIQSQYGASPHLKGIVNAFAEQIDPNGDIGLFFDKIFNSIKPRLQIRFKAAAFGFPHSPEFRAGGVEQGL